jgi:hypothetical protein
MLDFEILFVDTKDVRMNIQSVSMEKQTFRLDKIDGCYYSAGIRKLS